MSTTLRRPATRSALERLLLDDIEKLIAKDLRSREKPKLSVKELVVIAAVFKPCRTIASMLQWTLEHFFYYGNLAFRELSKGLIYGGSGSQNFRKAFEAAFRSLGVPVFEVAKEPSLWTVTTLDARTFLRLNKAPGSQYHFRFFDLPAEIRNTIYGMLLSLQRGGINLTRRSGGPIVQALSKDINKNIPVTDWVGEPKYYGSRVPEDLMEGGHLSDYLDLFRVSHQFCRESSAIFYGTNCFITKNMSELNELVDNTPLHKLNLIRHLAVTLHPRIGRGYYNGKLLTPKELRGLAALGNMPSLRKLDVCMWESEWTEVKKTTKDKLPKYPDPVQTPAVRLLQNIRGTAAASPIGSLLALI